MNKRNSQFSILKTNEKIFLFSMFRRVLAWVFAFKTGEWRKAVESQSRRVGSDILHSSFIGNIVSEKSKFILDRIQKEEEFLKREIYESEKSAENYLWVTNAGGLAAIVAFVSGTVNINIIRDNMPILFSCILFSLSIIFIGTIKALKLIRNTYIHGEYTKDMMAFIGGAISFEEMTIRLSLNKKKYYYIFRIAWLCYFLFGAGYVVSATALVVNGPPAKMQDKPKMETTK